MDTLAELRLRADRLDVAGAAAYLRAELEAGRLWRVSLLGDTEVLPGLGHAYSDDFAARLPGLLKAVSRSSN